MKKVTIITNEFLLNNSTIGGFSLDTTDNEAENVLKQYHYKDTDEICITHDMGFDVIKKEIIESISIVDLKKLRKKNKKNKKRRRKGHPYEISGYNKSNDRIYHKFVYSSIKKELILFTLYFCNNCEYVDVLDFLV